MCRNININQIQYSNLTKNLVSLEFTTTIISCYTKYELVDDKGIVYCKLFYHFNSILYLHSDKLQIIDKLLVIYDNHNLICYSTLNQQKTHQLSSNQKRF